MVARQNCILVTGGAGYIGSHTVLRIFDDARSDVHVVVVDDISRSCEQQVDDLLRAAMPPQDNDHQHQPRFDRNITFVRGDCGDTALMHKLLVDFDVGTVLHFAGPCYVAESIVDPLLYYEGIAGVTLRLLRAIEGTGVETFVYSSSCATYGNCGGGEEGGVAELTPQVPESPYGWAKYVAERQIIDWAHARPADAKVEVTVLRYFNVIGSDPQQRLGPRWQAQFARYARLVDALFGAVVAERPFRVRGRHYPTPDGTAVRDFVHVWDLANAHILACGPIAGEGNVVRVFNVGSGTGTSVMEMVEAARRITGLPLEVVDEPAAAGDPAFVTADPTHIRINLGWRPEFTIDDMLRTHWAWFQRDGVYH